MLRQLIATVKAEYTSASPEQDLLRAQAMLGLLAVFPFSIWRFFNGEWLLGLIDLTIVVGMLLMLAGIRRYFRPVSILFTLIYTTGMLTVVHLKGAEMLFWAYPTAGAGYFLLRLKEAILLSLFSLLLTVWMLLDALPLLQLVSFIITYLLICLFSSVFAQRVALDREQLTRKATQDPLTGAGNRRALDDAITQHLSQHPPYTCALLLFDVDHFKVVNDRYGHSVGDQFLQRFVQFLGSFLSPKDQLFRFGGEEFVIITPITAHAAIALAEQIRSQLQRTRLISRHYVTVSVGVAILRPKDSAREWVRRADDALYQAKNNGRNQICTDQTEAP